jgi:hypothetical protein
VVTNVEDVSPCLRAFGRLAKLEREIFIAIGILTVPINHLLVLPAAPCVFVRGLPVWTVLRGSTDFVVPVTERVTHLNTLLNRNVTLLGLRSVLAHRILVGRIVPVFKGVDTQATSIHLPIRHIIPMLFGRAAPLVGEEPAAWLSYDWIGHRLCFSKKLSTSA